VSNPIKETLMNKRSSLFSAALIAAFAGLGLTGQAHASSTIHGSICKAYNNTLTDYQAIFSGSTGTANHDSVYSRNVICPITRRTGSNGVTVWIEGGASLGSKVSCTLTSRYGGVYKGYASFESYASYFDQGMTLNAAQAPYWAKLDVICTLPVSGRGRISGISLND
jgi:hypothetical protein